jgi:hypothetical protein
MSTFAQLYGSYLDIELGSADTSALFTTARRKDAVNRAQQEFGKQTECFTKSVSIPLSDGTREYDLEAVITADDFLAIGKDGVEFVFTDADGNVSYRSGDDFPRLDLDILNREQQGWRSAASASFPQSYYVREHAGKVYLGFSEPPAIESGESASVTLPYVAMPPDMTGDTDEPFSLSAGSDPKKSLRPWHQALVHYAAALLEPLRKNFDGEQRQRQLFAAHVADYLQRKRKRGGSRVVFARDYRGEARGRGSLYGPQRDWRTWP